MSELKKCPFCGEEVYITTDKHDTKHWVECRKCGVTMIPTDTAEYAKERWNRRVIDQYENQLLRKALYQVCNDIMNSFDSSCPDEVELDDEKGLPEFEDCINDSGYKCDDNQKTECWVKYYINNVLIRENKEKEKRLKNNPFYNM